MVEKRKLTEQETRAAKRLDGIFKEKKSELGLTQQKMADSLGVTQGAIFQWKSGKTPIGYEALFKISAYLKVSPSDIYPELVDGIVSEDRESYRSESVIAYETPEELPDGEFIMINRLDVKAACEDRYKNGDYPKLKDKVAFRADFIKRSKAQSMNLMIVTVEGNSMLPTIAHGDDALIDCDQSTVRNGNVYAFFIDGEFKIKRLYIAGGKLIAHSDNESDPAFKYDDEYESDTGISIIGRIVNRSGSGGL